MTAEAICIATGPSLNDGYVERVRLWHGDGRRVYVCNNASLIAPWADAMFAHDPAWWYHYGTDFRGVKYSPYQIPGTEHLPVWKMRSHGNSGAAIIMLAMRDGAHRIGLIGYDCKKGEKAHCHEDHPAPMTNCSSIKQWPAIFRQVAAEAKSSGVQVFNCSGDTALTVFPRLTIDEFIGHRRQRPERHTRADR